ncbi:MAG: maleylpyruvate isomerase family mycothiol-dependent enzyme [Propionibacteriales bacterium]|nr:maleylpyruvate isomerase family mycothiol-dependent enzyme [Propionibacteriales bacterium]
MDLHLDYLDHLARESASFASALTETPSEAAVPTCPDWNADNLLWHLAEVQWFWGTIVRERLTEASRAEELKPDRPGDRAGLMAFYEQASRDLGEILAATSPETEVWTWAPDHSVGFIRRRQAHEALIHRIDAELTADARTPMDPPLSSDGVDEALRVMYGGVPPWGAFTPDNAKTLRFQATDTGDSWFVSLGRFTGTNPDNDKSYDEPDIHAADTDSGREAAATVAGSAADLDCWLWRRPTVEPLARSGQQDVLAEFESIISGGID